MCLCVATRPLLSSGHRRPVVWTGTTHRRTDGHRAPNDLRTGKWCGWCVSPGVSRRWRLNCLSVGHDSRPADRQSRPGEASRTACRVTPAPIACRRMPAAASVWLETVGQAEQAGRSVPYGVSRHSCTNCLSDGCGSGPRTGRARPWNTSYGVSCHTSPNCLSGRLPRAAWRQDVLSVPPQNCGPGVRPGGGPWPSG